MHFKGPSFKALLDMNVSELTDDEQWPWCSLVPLEIAHGHVLLACRVMLGIRNNISPKWKGALSSWIDPPNCMKSVCQVPLFFYPPLTHSLSLSLWVFTVLHGFEVDDGRSLWSFTRTTTNFYFHGLAHLRLIGRRDLKELHVHETGKVCVAFPCDKQASNIRTVYPSSFFSRTRRFSRKTPPNEEQIIGLLSIDYYFGAGTTSYVLTSHESLFDC